MKKKILYQHTNQVKDCLFTRLLLKVNRVNNMFGNNKT
jgi:hypothetical protein